MQEVEDLVGFKRWTSVLFCFRLFLGPLPLILPSVLTCV